MKLLIYTFCTVLLLSSLIGCDLNKTKEPPKSGKVKFNIYVDPATVHTAGGSFTLNITQDDSGSNPRNARLWISKGSSGCRALDIPLNNIYKDSAYSVLLNTSQFDPNCTGHFVFPYTLSILFSDTTVFGYLTWDTLQSSGPRIDTVNLGTYYMTDNSLSACQNALTCVRNSFKNSNSDSDIVRILPKVPTFISGVRNEHFTDIVFDSIAIECDTFAQHHHTTNDTFQIYYALDHIDDASYGGVSNNSSWRRGTINWSFVFMQTIDNIYPASTYVRQSIYNHVSVHELIHQIGKVGNEGHYSHGDPYANRCALYPSSHFDSSGDYRTTTNFYRVCQAHAVAMRSNLEQTSFASGQNGRENFSPIFPTQNTDDKQTISMTLSKNSYKEFEPIIAKFEIVNRDDKPFNIYGMFDPNLTESNFKISDNLGNQWDTNKIPFVIDAMYSKPVYIIQPGDTFVVSMPLNNWAEKIYPKNFSDYCFGEYGYFPSDRTYKVFFYNGTLVSNEVQFEVANLNYEDKDAIDLYKKGTANLAIAKYPDNTLTEYITAKNLISLYWQIFNSKHGNVSALVNDYESFLVKYPKTYYVYDDRFMAPYFTQQFKNKNNYAAVINEVKNKVNNNQLNKLLSNRDVENRIKNTLRRFPVRHKK